MYVRKLSLLISSIKDGSNQNKMFFHVLNYIGIPMKEKLARSNYVLVCLLFRRHFFVAAPLGYCPLHAQLHIRSRNTINFSFSSCHHQIAPVLMVQEWLWKGHHFFAVVGINYTFHPICSFFRHGLYLLQRGKTTREERKVANIAMLADRLPKKVFYTCYCLLFRKVT